MKEFSVTKSSVTEIQNLVVNPKSEPVNSNSKRYQFLFEYISNKKSMRNFLKLITFLVSLFAKKDFFLKTLAK